MEIENYRYLRSQSRLVKNLRFIAIGLRDILMLVLDVELSGTIGRLNTSAYGLADILTNTLQDYEDELEKMRKSAIKEKEQKGK